MARRRDNRAMVNDAPHGPVAGSQRPAILVLGLLALWLLATIGLRPLMLPDEGRYAGVAFAMLGGDWLTPHLHGLPYFHKPPLMYWIDAAAMQVLGAHAFAARLAPALGAWVMGAALWFDLRRRSGVRAATIALAALATTPLFFGGAQFANHDMLVAGLLTVAIVCGARAIEADAAWRRWSVAAWTAAALAVLAKGLIGVVLPALVLVPWLLAQGRWRALPRLLHPLALLAFAAVATPWFAAMALRHPGFLDYFFLEQHVRRYAQAGFNNVQPFWFFLPVLLLLALPWTLWLPGLLRRRRLPPGTPLALYAWWVAAVVLFFSLPASKLVGYVLPALAPLAGLLGLAAAHGRAWRWALALAAVACVAIIVGVARHEGNSHRDIALELRQQLQPGDRVVFAGEPFFDVPFYARLPQPPVVLDDWDDPAILRRDDWRKELRDAARFDPPAGGRLLLRPAQAATLACGPGTTWVLAPPAWQPLPALGPLQRVRDGRRAVLWRSAGRGAACP